MQHFTVVHKRNYVVPLTGAHTQTIVSLWSRVKDMMCKLGVFNSSRDLFLTYLPEYVRRKKFSKDKVLDLIIELYPLYVSVRVK
uniref:Putative LOC101856368 [Aplysia californica] n=1 Tax=Lepeophtheirus salmonis TaxID=72036 RepID=A0A0K2VDV5_LEPSM